MKKEEVIDHLRKIASLLADKKYITLENTRSVPKLDYYIHFHFRGLGKALKAANLPSSKLASSMSIKNEDLLSYLKDLRDKLGHNPTVWDIQDDDQLYKKYSANKFSWSILKSRFGGLRKAIEQMEKGYKKDATITVQTLQTREQEKEN